jgi:hypothetical protein
VNAVFFAVQCKIRKLKCFVVMWWNAVKQYPTYTTTTMATYLSDSNHRAFLKQEFGFDSVWTEATVKCSDGSIYKGHLDRNGKRTGFGTLRYPIMLYGAVDPENMSSLIHWMEYKGTWQDDEASGYGILTKFRGDGTSNVIFEGEWRNGDRVEDDEDREEDEDRVEEDDEDRVESVCNKVIGW